MQRKSIYVFTISVILGFLAAGGWFVLRGDSNDIVVRSHGKIITETEPEDKTETETKTEPKITQGPVPFTSQAPFANWDNAIFQQGCEEASILMAMFWVEGKKLISPKDAESAIRAISSFERENYGEFRDTSAADTARVARDYFGYSNIDVKDNVDAADIKVELVRGNLVVVPVNGQKLGNPFYTPPGPIQHMLVIRGYDAAKREFITNDPGTKRGELFRYDEDILENALQDYETGYKEPIIKANKAMIVVRPRS